MEVVSNTRHRITIKRNVPGRSAEIRDGFGYLQTSVLHSLVDLEPPLGLVTLIVGNADLEDALGCLFQTVPCSLVFNRTIVQTNQPICQAEVRTCGP